eukprot:m.114789 g.114789  ORF g.114789 m.114789 type:complete len:101 (-) comp17126_c0_seq1:837-1139(-)
MVEMARDAGRIAPSKVPTESSQTPRTDPRMLQALQAQCQDKDARIVFLEGRLKEALQRARQGRPLSGSPIGPRRGGSRGGGERLSERMNIRLTVCVGVGG